MVGLNTRHGSIGSFTVSIVPLRVLELGAGVLSGERMHENMVWHGVSKVCII
jgi:hypothetical protein